MKKVLSMALTFCMLFLVFLIHPVLANDENTILSEKAPAYLDEVAKKELPELIFGDSDTSEALNKTKNTNDFYCGDPFNIYIIDSSSNLVNLGAYNYPIISDGQIIALMTILDEKQDNNEYLWSFGSNELAEALNTSLANAKKKNFTKSILVQNGDDILLCDEKGNTELLLNQYGSGFNSVASTKLNLLVSEKINNATAEKLTTSKINFKRYQISPVKNTKTSALNNLFFESKFRKIPFLFTSIPIILKIPILTLEILLKYL